MNKTRKTNYQLWALNRIGNRQNLIGTYTTFTAAIERRTQLASAANRCRYTTYTINPVK